MASDDSELNGSTQTKSSRRSFLKTAAGLALAGATIGYNQKAEANETYPPLAPGKPRLLYVGTYSSSGFPPSYGKGIYLYEMDPATGALTERQVLPTSLNPSWITLNPAKTHLYSCDEIHHYQGKANLGAVSSYSIDPATGHLSNLNTASSAGDGPAYVSVHPSGRYLFAANYGDGSISVLPIRSNGELGSAVFMHRDEGPVGPLHAASAPRGSFAISGHHNPHAHMIHADPTGKRVLSTDLGMDKIFIWNFDLASGKLTPNDPHSLSVPPGDGPRHFVFHPNGRWFYCIMEEGSAVVAYDYNTSSGRLTQKQVISTVPNNFAGTSMASEIRISPDAKFIYGASRVHDTITTFSIGSDGKLKYVSDVWTGGYSPRSITVDPSGNFIYSCNQFSSNITCFRVDKRTGKLTFTGQYTPVGTPACMVFLT